MTKICNICEEPKELSEYSPRPERPCGFEGRCKSCNAKRALANYHKNREVLVVNMRERAKKRYQKDPSVAKFQATLRKKHVKRATPVWTDKTKLIEFYKNCPAGFHVDHIIPLRGKEISGLNVIENLQYLPASVNASKKNAFNVLEYNLSKSARLPA